MIWPSSHNFTDDEAALFLSLYGSLPPHFEYVDTNENRMTDTVNNIPQVYKISQRTSRSYRYQYESPVDSPPSKQPFTYSITRLIPPNYKYTNSSPTKLQHQRHPTTSLTVQPHLAHPNMISEPFPCFMLHSITITSSTSLLIKISFVLIKAFSVILTYQDAVK